jgi:hypothetical protein
MRRIVSKTEKKKKQRINQIIVGGVLIVIMFMSVLGYAFYGQTDSEDSTKKLIYGDYEFLISNGYYLLNLGNYQFGFRTNPKESLGEIQGNLNKLNAYSNKPLYIFTEDPQASNEIGINLGNMAQRIQFACLEEENCEENLPIKNCSDNFISISKSEENLIKQEENCVFIEGKEEELIKVVDEFLYHVIGVK